MRLRKMAAQERKLWTEPGLQVCSLPAEPWYTPTMRALIRRWPMATAFTGLMVLMFLLPVLYTGLPGGLWLFIPAMYFLPTALRGLWQDFKQAKRWLRARTTRVKVSDEALHAFLAERTDERQ